MKTVPDSTGKETAVPDDFVRTCSQCSHVLGVRGHLNIETARCNANENKFGINLVTGNPEFRIPFCADQRRHDEDGRCGEFGKWFVFYIYPEHIYKQDSKEQTTRSRPGSASIDIGM